MVRPALAAALEAGDLEPRVLDVAEVVELAGSHGLFCARRRTGEVDCWGWVPTGGLVTLTPRRIPQLARATAIRVLGLRVCGLVNGAVRCWGRDASGLPIEDFTNVGPPP